ncbi:MAG: hypothetical protein D5S00_11675 [Tindallia sp. MSAO_Bac2]|nr:MAG: hypothetical protein D5S00_11675 [Tindallia sp. MSAO_Bac2]
MIPLLIIAGLFLLLYSSPLFYQLRSYLIMMPYSHYHYRSSLAANTNLDIRIPAGRSTTTNDWYPWTLYYHDTGFSRVTQLPYDLTILYTFGHFPTFHSGSSYYDSESPYHGSFYGAYLLRNQDDKAIPFGFDGDGNVIKEKWISIPEYDQRYLVLPTLGLRPEKVTFETKDIQMKDSVTYVDFSNWTMMDAIIITNSPQHQFIESRRGYLQYGLPSGKVEKEFKEVEMAGRIYARHFNEQNMTLGLYIIAPDFQILDYIDQNFLSKSEITGEKF